MIKKSARSIPSLDGLRALSILIVILAHSDWYEPDAIRNNIVFRMAIGNGRHGVAVFFVISGFLITTLLLKEAANTGRVSLPRFYFRRSLRIFPAFYVFLAVMALLWWRGIVPEDPHSFAAASTYTVALFTWVGGFFIFHSWSLSVEELYYLFWPCCFAFLHNQQSRLFKLTIGIIAMMPVLRVALYFVAPDLRGHEGYMIHGWIDTIMMGCLLALLPYYPKWNESLRRFATGWVAAAAAITGFFLDPLAMLLLPRHISGFFGLAISPTLLAVCIALILLYSITRVDSVFGAVLNVPPVAHIGRISYSLYVWQQIFVSGRLVTLPFGYFAALAVAEMSYWFIETPMLRLRSRWEGTLWKRERQLTPAECVSSTTAD